MSDSKKNSPHKTSSCFLQDVLKGLASSPKYLPSRYFYDEVGDKLFQEIMSLKEYYLSRSETAIIKKYKDDILHELGDNFRLLELGVGDGTKTKILLKDFLNKKIDFIFSPVDISKDVLNVLEKELRQEMPLLHIESLSGDYFKMMSQAVQHHTNLSNAVLFLGSNIGNYSDALRNDFLSNLRKHLKKGDKLLIGIDLKKDPNKIISAYYDQKGVTTLFNKNLLTRINKELGANFNTENFTHFPSYDPCSGECKSFLLSTTKQTIQIDSAQKEITLERWEPILMEISKKFNLSEIENLATKNHFRIVKHFMVDDDLFVDSLWEAVE